ncbi:MAG: DUF2225 domain-containing protein [Melioribacteraceae bacterium]|nr:DUF2225 domain-containing protein [Melioribacteraceae bacterium]
MTMLSKRKIKCFVCQKESEQDIVLSTSSVGYADLDFRFPPLKRYTIEFDIQRCPNCFYCSQNISKGIDEVKQIITTEKYKTIIISDLDEKVASFLASAEIYTQLGKTALAAIDIVYCTWIYDDRGDVESAKLCRILASNYIKSAIKNGKQVGTEEGQSEQLLIDVLRRAGMFKDALEQLEQFRRKKIISSENRATFHKIMDYEENLIQKKDVDGHTIGEALNIN